jgi:hypothetical protein
MTEGEWEAHSSLKLWRARFARGRLAERRGAEKRGTTDGTEDTDGGGEPPEGGTTGRGKGRWEPRISRRTRMGSGGTGFEIWDLRFEIFFGAMIG